MVALGAMLRIIPETNRPWSSIRKSCQGVVPNAGFSVRCQLSMFGIPEGLTYVACACDRDSSELKLTRFLKATSYNSGLAACPNAVAAAVTSAWSGQVSSTTTFTDAASPAGGRKLEGRAVATTKRQLL